MSNHPSLVTMDTRDDRRELWSLLHRLPPRQRVAFLARCCARVRAADPRGNGPVPSPGLAGSAESAYRCDRADLRLTNEIYADCLILAAQWNFDLAAAAVELERRVRETGRR